MENEAYVCRETGKVYWRSDIVEVEEPLPDDIEDDDKYISIPHKNDLGLGKPLALRFADQYLPDSVEKVREIFSRRGAYARFKDLLEYKDLLQQWYDFEENAQEQALREWCRDNYVKVED